jgi:hypothetical protein
LPQGIDTTAQIGYNAIALAEKKQVPDERIMDSRKEPSRMKKTLLVLSLSTALVLAFATVALADAGGKPAAHGAEDGKAFGGLVSSLAKSGPGAVADHVSNAGGGGGMPAAHGAEDGKAFGGLVSELAKSYPGAVADHIGSN